METEPPRRTPVWSHVARKVRDYAVGVTYRQLDLDPAPSVLQRVMDTIQIGLPPEVHSYDVSLRITAHCEMSRTPHRPSHREPAPPQIPPPIASGKDAEPVVLAYAVEKSKGGSARRPSTKKTTKKPRRKPR